MKTIQNFTFNFRKISLAEAGQGLQKIIRALKIYGLLLLFTVFALGFLAGCEDEDVDVEKPIVTIGLPAEHAVFAPGDTIHLEVDLSDNVGLKQYKVDVHYGGGHEHKSLGIIQTPVEWSYDYIGNVDGRNRHLHRDIVIPANARTGEYHLMVFATDQSGNEAFDLVEIYIQIPLL